MEPDKFDSLLLGALSEWDDVQDFCDRHDSLSVTEKIEFRTTVGIANSVLKDAEAAAVGMTVTADQATKMDELRRMAVVLNPIAKRLLSRTSVAA